MDAIQEWLDKNTFYCEKLRLRLTPERCREIRSRISIKECPNEGHFWDSRLFRPFMCDNCDKNPERSVPVRTKINKTKRKSVKKKKSNLPPAIPIASSYAKRVSKLLKLFRAEHQLSQADLADILGIGPTTIMHWEAMRNLNDANRKGKLFFCIEHALNAITEEDIRIVKAHKQFSKRIAV